MKITRVSVQRQAVRPDMYAIWLAGAFTGRDKILKFEGSYHGMSAEAQISLAPARVTPVWPLRNKIWNLQGPRSVRRSTRCCEEPVLILR